MLKQLKHLRDFLDDEQMRELPISVRVRSCILLRQKKKVKGITEWVLQVFDEDGNWIGEISHPDFIPSNKQ